jgi:fatty-acyl-CoA synthase
MPNSEFAPGTCTALILEAAAVHADADAIVLPEDRVSYRGLAAGAADWSRIFIAIGVSKGEHVGVLLPNGTQFMQVLFGAMLAGAVPVPINVRYRGPELAALLADADLVTVVTTNDVEYHPSLIERLHEALPELSSAGAPERLSPRGRLSLALTPRLRNIVAAQGPPSPGILQLGAVAASITGIADEEIERRRRSVRPGDTALILYTSGSTARPKGCMLSHAAIVAQGRLLAARYQMSARDRIWSPLPMFHVGGISPLMAIASVGGAFLSMRRIEAGAGLAMMASERATISFALFQTIIADLLQHPSFAKHDLSAIRLMVSNFSLQPPWIRELLAARLPRAVQIGTFGLTETVASACTHSPDDPADDRLHRLGRPLPGIEVRVIDEGGRDAAPGNIGEVLLRGPTLCSGYYRDPQRTADALRDGWLYTGDRGSVDARGSVMFHGRLKDVLKVGGENVGALEIETVVGQHPAVKGSAVVGVPDPRLEEVPVVFVELRPDAQATEEQLLAFCKGKLASFKIPRRAYFLTEWPMSATKIDKPALVRRLIGEGNTK